MIQYFNPYFYPQFPLLPLPPHQHSPPVPYLFISSFPPLPLRFPPLLNQPLFTLTLSLLFSSSPWYILPSTLSRDPTAATPLYPYPLSSLQLLPLIYSSQHTEQGSHSSNPSLPLPSLFSSAPPLDIFFPAHWAGIPQQQPLFTLTLSLLFSSSPWYILPSTLSRDPTAATPLYPYPLSSLQLLPLIYSSQHTEQGSHSSNPSLPLPSLFSSAPPLDTFFPAHWAGIPQQQPLFTLTLSLLFSSSPWYILPSTLSRDPTAATPLYPYPLSSLQLLPLIYSSQHTEQGSHSSNPSLPLPSLFSSAPPLDIFFPAHWAGIPQQQPLFTLTLSLLFSSSPWYILPSTLSSN